MSLTCSTQRAILRLKAKGNFFIYLYNSGECFFFHSSHKRWRKGIGKYKLIMKFMYHKRETIKSSSGVKELENRRVSFAGHGSLVTGHRSRVAGHRSRVAGHRSRVTGHGSQVTGHRSRVTGHMQFY